MHRVYFVTAEFELLLTRKNAWLLNFVMLSGEVLLLDNQFCTLRLLD